MGGTSGFSLVEVQRKVREIWHETIAPPWMRIALREIGVMNRLREIVSPKKRRQRGKWTGMEETFAKIIDALGHGRAFG